MKKEDKKLFDERLKTLTEENSRLRNELSAMELRYREAYVEYKIFQELFVNEIAGNRKEARLFYYTFLTLRNIKTKDLKKNDLVRKTLLDISNKYKIYPEDELIKPLYKGEKYYTDKMAKLYRTYYEHWRKKLQGIRKEYFKQYDIHSENIPLYNPMEPLP